MSSSKKIAEFPDVEAKLQQPSKQSAFERQKAEAEAKRRREAAETAAVYEDFVKSFDHGEDDAASAHGSRPGPPRFGSGPPERPAFGGQAPYGGGPGKRHFGIPPGAPKSGPGSLGPVPSSFGKKRQYDGFHQGFQREADEVRGRLGFEDPETDSLSRAFDAGDDEEKALPAADRAEEKAISKPTLRLANLPPGTSPAFIKTIIPSNLTVENVKIVPPSGPSITERKSIAAIVTLSKESPATEIDAAVSALQNRYLGFGYFLSLHRHLSSAAIASGLATVSSSAAVSNPFGAKRVEDIPGAQGPQPIGHGRGYAPPPSYGPPLGGSLSRSGLLHVPIKPPRDIRKLRMIHKVIESVLEYGPDFEALLMSRPGVQREEEWAWIWDARSEDAVYYRFTLWKIVTGFQSKAQYIPLFEGSHAWKAPDQPLTYEYTTAVDEFVSDSEYNSSDDEFEDEQTRHAESGPGINEQEDTFLNPIDKSKLAHLLARLPTTLSRIRKGDIARITAFAITHASRGASEVVDMIVSNIELPFAYTSANPDHRTGRKDKDGQDEDSRDASPTVDEKTPADTIDTSAARLLGVYVVSDILSSASTSGIRHAWRYRQYFETALRNRKTFELLGTMADKQNWGRLRADKWKRSIGLVLNLWEGWCVFPVETHAFFVDSFENPPLPSKEPSGESDTAKKDAGRWKPVEALVTEGGPPSSNTAGDMILPVSEHNTSNHPSPATEGQEYIEKMMETGDTDGEVQSPRLQYSSGIEELFSDEDLDGDPDEDFLAFVSGTVKGGDTTMGGLDATPEQTPPTDRREIKSVAGFQMSVTKAPPSRKRMRAVDMFAGSESEDER